MATSVIAGTTVRFYTSQAFEDVTGVSGDPETVIFAYSISNGEVQQFVYSPGSQIVRDGEGLYHIDLDTTGLEGLWTYTFIGKGFGGIQARGEGELQVVLPAVNA